MTIQTRPVNSEVLAHYMELPYNLFLTRSEDGWGAMIVELPGCIGAGDTIEEALEMLNEAKEAWISSCLMDDDPVPVPLADPHHEFSRWQYQLRDEIAQKNVGIDHDPQPDLTARESRE